MKPAISDIIPPQKYVKAYPAKSQSVDQAYFSILFGTTLEHIFSMKLSKGQQFGQ